MEASITIQEPVTAAEVTTHYPTLLKRVQSIFIDTIFILLLMFGISAIIDNTQDEVPGWVRAIIFFGLWFVYEPLATALGCTFGNYLIGIRVRKADNENRRINIFQAYIRFILKLLLGWLSFITIHLNEQRRAVHDLAAGTVMIQKQA